MAYFLKYKLEYTSHGNYDTKIEILKKDYEGEVISLVGSATPFHLAYEANSNSQFSTFKSSYCTLEVKLTESIKTDFIEIEDEDDFILRYYRNNSLYWTGYILQEQYYEGDDNNNPFVSLKFYDAIARLRVFDINDTGLVLDNYSFSIGSIFQSINELLYLNIGSTGFKGNDFLAVNAINGSSITGNCYDIIIEDAAKDDGTNFLYIETQEPNQAIVNKAYMFYPSSNFDYTTQTVTITICSINAPIFRYGSTGLPVTPVGVSVISNGLCLNSDMCLLNYTDSLFDGVHILKDSLFDKDNNAYTLFDILERISSAFNFTYLMYIDSFYVHNFEFSNNPKFIDYGNFKNIVSINHNTVINSNQFWVNKSKGINFLDSLKKIEVFHTVDGDLSYLVIGDFTEVTKLREYVSEPDPITTDDTITFSTFADIKIARGGAPARSYKDVYVTNASPFFITNDSLDNRYRLSYNIRFEFDYGITDLEFEALSESEKFQLEEYIKEIEANTEIRMYYQIKSIKDGVTKYLTSSRLGISKYEVWDGWTIEVNTGVGLGNRGGDGVSISSLLEGYDYEVDIPAQLGDNEMYISFFQPYVVTDVEKINANNTYRIEGVNMIISNLKLINVAKLDIEEIRFEGVTNRNVFNYNLNRDKEIFYLNLEELSYTFNILGNNNSVLKALPFSRKTKDYLSIRNENLNVQDFLLKQSLEQLGFQQQYITGELMIRDNNSFDIFSTITIGSKIFAIGKFNYNDKTGVYQIDLIEIK